MIDLEATAELPLVPFAFPGGGFDPYNSATTFGRWVGLRAARRA